jgi:hypothetical protein
MRRSSSGSDIASSSRFSSAAGNDTPYVYMPPSSPDTPCSITSPGGRNFRALCSGGTISKLPLQPGGAITLPRFVGQVHEYTGAHGFMHAYDVHTGEMLFRLPVGSIGRVRTRASMPFPLMHLCTCCIARRANVLVLDVEAPPGWLHWGPTGLSGSLRLDLDVGVEIQPWLDAMGIELDDNV